MQQRFFSFSRLILLAVPLLASVVPSQPASSAVTTSATVLQNCPSVDEEIVDLEMLSSALRESKAVGLFEKVKLKRSIDDMLARFEAFHDGRRDYSMEQLEEQYNVLLMRIASHLQHKDQILHQQLCNAWLLIWLDLEDSARFREKFLR